MSQRRTGSSIARSRQVGPARRGSVWPGIVACAVAFLAWGVAGCSSLPECKDCVMPADEHGYGPFTPFGFYETHWNTWPTECDEDNAAEGEQVAPPAGTTPGTDTLPAPSDDTPSTPGGQTPGNLDDVLQLPDEQPKAAPPVEPAPGTPMAPDATPGAPMAPDATPGAPMAPGTTPTTPPATSPSANPLEEPPGGLGTPPSTLPSLPNPDALKPGEALPDNLLPKEQSLVPPKTDDEKKTKPTDAPKQSRLRQRDLSGPRLPASRGHGTPELEFPKNRIRKTSAAESPASRPATDGSGWRAKGGAVSKPRDDSGAAWQGRRAPAPSVNRQASHVENADRPAQVEPAGGAGATGNPLR